MPKLDPSEGRFPALSDAGFDGELDQISTIVTEACSKGDMEDYYPTVFLVYKKKLEVLGLVSEKEDDLSDVYGALLEFGRQVSRKKQVPQAAFVGVPTEWEDGSECIFVAGCTPDGRKNGVRIRLSRNSAGMLGVDGKESLYRTKGAAFEGRTYAGEFMKGFLEGAGT